MNTQSHVSHLAHLEHDGSSFGPGGGSGMIANAEVALLDSRYSGATTCLVCCSPIGAGEGFTALYRGRLLRFKCASCLSRFSADPERFMSGHAAECCDHQDSSPFSEWCD